MLAHAIGQLADAVADVGHLVFGALLELRAFLDQLGKHAAALLLRLGECAQAGLPDLLRRRTHGVRQFLVFRQFLQFLHHRPLP